MAIPLDAYNPANRPQWSTSALRPPADADHYRTARDEWAAEVLSDRDDIRDRGQ